MHVRGPLVVVGLLLVIAIGVVLSWSLLRDDVATPLPHADAMAAPAAAAPARSEPVATAPAARHPGDAAPTRTLAPTAAPQARIRGSCVDENGAPLAGCSVRLTASPTGNERTAAWQNPEPLATGADGDFAFDFQPPANHLFWLQANCAGRISTRAYWPAINAGEQIDVGVLVLRPGIVVRGNVVDEQGVAIANIGLVVRVGPRNEAPGPRNSSFARSASDGTFALDTALPPGEFVVEVHGDRTPKTPITGTLVMDRQVEVVQVVLPTFDPREWIQGRVVDDAGRVIANAFIRTSTESGTDVAILLSGRDGAFRIPRPANLANQLVRIAAQHSDYEDNVQTEPIGWGSTDVVLTLPRASGLAVHVTDEQERPLTEFKVSVIADPNGPRGGINAIVTAEGPFPTGIATVAHVRRGKRIVIVELPPEQRHPPVFQPIEVLQGTVRVDVRREAVAERVARIVNRAGSAVTGTQVQLCDPVDGEFLESTQALPLDLYLRTHGPKKALVIQTGTTAADGTLLLRGPASLKLGVRALGPGHVPAHQADVRLADPGELRITVTVGSRLRGRIGPQAALDFLVGLAGDAAAQARNPLTLNLQSISMRDAEQKPLSCRIARDGTFDQGDLPTGNYLVDLQFPLPGRELLGEVTLVDGQTTHFDAELPVDQMTPGTLTGRVLKNGVPLADAGISLIGTTPEALGRTRGEVTTARTDTQGRFRANVRPGSYTASVTIPNQGFGVIPTTETALVRTRQTTEQDFTFATGQLVVTLRDAANATVPGVTLYDARATFGPGITMLPTDPEGTTRCEQPAQTLTLRTLPKRLQSNEASIKLFMEGGWQAFEPHWIPLGTATIRAGEITTLELRLPADWEK